MQNPFTNTAFSMTALTNAINILPINYGRVENLNLFPSRSVRFRHITIEEHNGVLSLLPTQIPDHAIPKKLVLTYGSFGCWKWLCYLRS